MSGGFKAAGDTPNAHYCGDRKKNPSIVYWVANEDIDCDGSKPCAGDPSGQGQTAFDFNGRPLNAFQDPYVVINQQSEFNPTNFGVEPLAAVTVLCRGKMYHGFWGDTNALGTMGEVSISLGQACFGKSVNGNSASSQAVLYIAHTGKDAVVSSPSGSEVVTFGNKLISNINFSVDLNL